jgi:predicted NUDIX family phosphoesterase
MTEDERVLVVGRETLKQAGMFQGVTFDVERYLGRFFAAGAARFVSRSEAEADPGYKQLIPYVIMTCGGKYLSYVRGRRAGESRLVGHRSIGIGGHINPADDMPLFSAGLGEAYATAVEREVAEEVCVEAHHTDDVVALLNDDSTEVGQVHLGIVHLWVLDRPDVVKREQMITQMTFMSPAELQEVRDTLETWSRLCLDHLGEMAKRGKQVPGFAGRRGMGERNM